MPGQDHKKPTGGGDRPIPIPLSDDDRTKVIAQLAALNANVRGDNVPRLVELVETALNPVPATEQMLGVTAETYGPYSDARQSIHDDLIAMADRARHILSTVRALPRFPRAADPFLAGAAPLRYGPRDGETRPALVAVSDLRKAVELLARLSEPNMTRLRGAPYDVGIGAYLVRAVCLYIHEQCGLHLSMTWSSNRERPGGRRGGARARLGDDWDMPTHTAVLIVETAAAFGLGLDATTLRTHLDNFARELRTDGRPGQPTDADLYGPMFDSKPKPSKVANANPPSKTVD